jgi:ribonucleoside-diphosphate reductase alpha chain
MLTSRCQAYPTGQLYKGGPQVKGKDGSTAPKRAAGAVQRKRGSWSEPAERVLRERYLLRNAEGKVVETPDDLLWRVASAVASAEDAFTERSGRTADTVAETFYDLMVEHKFLPNSPTLMNAGKGNNLQLSACYVVPVEDSLPGIFEAVKHAALIHQSGGGCIAGDAHVFTTFCGVEAIATLYERVRATGKAEHVEGDHAVIDVRDLGIETMALVPEHGTYERAQVTHLWRYDVPLDDQVRVRGANGLEVTTSRWHPFMVFRGTGLEERRADELQIGDILPTPNASVRGQWPHATYKEVAGVRLDEEISWFLGYFLGDGSLGWAKVPESAPRREMLRWRVFDGRTASLAHARDILARRFDVHLTLGQDGRGLYSLATTDSGFIARFRTLLPIEPGPKIELPFPEMVAKSPLSVVGAFLAGLVDSDGYVDNLRERVTFTTQSQRLASKVHTMCSLLGLMPGTRTRQPHGRGRSVVYEIKLASEHHVADLRALIGPYLNDSLKSERLAQTRGTHEHSTSTRLPIPFSAIEDILQSIGIVTDTTPIHRQPVRIGNVQIWLHRWKEGLGVNSARLAEVVAALRPLADARYQARLDVLAHLAQGATTVIAVEAPAASTPFYDFTVADHSTYLAGTNGLTAIHNTGFSFSRLRPEGSMVASTHGVASGPVSFMKIFDGATEAVKQGGTRRGANMGILRVDHPDVLKFIDCKRDGSVTNFNISVAITDEFMRALDADGEYDLVDPHSQQPVGRLRAREVMDRIVAAAWATGDPGLVFLDRANRSTANPTPEVELLEATNPCGEQWLGPYDACNLGSINLGAFVHAGQIDWAGIEAATRECTRFLDDVIDINPYPLPEVREKVRANRRIGLGVMGWAEMLFELGIRYDSEGAIALGERVMTSIREWSTDESRRMAEERGPFPNWERSVYKDGPALRNATRTTVAPTGSISILADCSSGIEPIFALAFQHRVKQPDGSYRVLDFVNPFFLRALEASDVADKDGVIAYVREHGSLHGHPAAAHPTLQPYVTAHEIAPEWHIQMQAAFQRGVDNSISKTINLPNSATYADVEQAYRLAWDLGCLGITVFRDGCKGEQVLNVGVKPAETASAHETAPSPRATAETDPAVATAEASVAPSRAARDPRYQEGVKVRPEVVSGYTRQVRAPEGKVNVTLNSDDDGLLEVFVNVGKAGSDVAALAEALGRLISLHLRIDSPLTQTDRAEEVARQLRSIGGSGSIGFGMDRVRSLPDAVARALEMHLTSSGAPGAGGAVYPVDSSAAEHSGGASGGSSNGYSAGGGRATGINPGTLALYTVTGNLCPHCGCNTLVYEEGCKKCHSCGHSEC